MPLENSSPSRLSTIVLTDLDALCALAPEWIVLWQESSGATPFQHPGWTIAWWRSFGPGRLWTITVRDADERLVAIAPLYLAANETPRTLRLIGAGTTDYLDVLVAPGFEQPAVAAIAEHLQGQAREWDEIDLDQLRAESPLVNGSTWPFETRVAAAQPCPMCRLDATRDAANPAGASRRLLANVAADRQRLERACGGATITRATAATLNADLDELCRLHAARWVARGEAGVLKDPAVESFHRDAARALLDAGILRLYVLRAGERVAGVYYGFLHRGRAYYYVGGFDPELRQYGIGNQLVAHAMAEAASEGAQTFDFLRGREPYKYRWGAVDRPTFRRVVLSRARVPAAAEFSNRVLGATIAPPVPLHPAVGVAHA